MTNLRHSRYFFATAKCSLVVAGFLHHSFAGAATSGVLGVSPETALPVHAAQGATPLVMLTMARDHTLFFPAYNDLSDLDGDGELDIRFKPTITYSGLYNSGYCYSYAAGTTSVIRNNDRTGLFSPAAAAVVESDPISGKPLVGKCVASGQSTVWSGNFLNYVTTSRMDALRVALYGGYREVDGTSQTIRRRAYIPQDGHAWAKEYTSAANDGYSISNYTPLAQPQADRRHFFGNLTSTANVDPTHTYLYNTNGNWDYPPVGTACETLSDCSDFPPLLRVVTNSYGDNRPLRVWDWASSERPVLSAVGWSYSWDDKPAPTYGSGNLTDYSVRVEVCTTDYLDGCKAYSDGTTTTYKPTGVLHDYGEDDSMYFGLLTGSYDQNLSGGRLRKNISSFGAGTSSEVNKTTGVFLQPTNSIISQINNIRIRNFNYYQGPATNDYGGYFSGNYIYRNGKSATPADVTKIFDNSYSGTDRLMTEGEYGDWGNPVAEMMYEGLRYFKGGASPVATGAYDNTTLRAEDTAVGLLNTTWADPYTADGKNWCAKPSQMVISSVNPSFDSDQLPGSKFGSFSDTLTADGGIRLNVGTIADALGNSLHENINNSPRFIGEVINVGSDGAPTIKTVNTLGQVRGLPPDDTNKQGSYYAAAVANFGREHSLRKIGVNNIPSVDTFVVALNSPIPKISIPFGSNTITVVPFARTIDAPDNIKGNFQPTNPIVGMYIDRLENTSNVNGNYALSFRVNYEDRSWGGDFEMDAIAYYEITATSSVLTIKVTPTYQSGGSHQNMGYVISGTTQDGAYLVVQDENYDKSYYLNVPFGRSPGYCDQAGPPADCNKLRNLGLNQWDTRTFVPASTSSPKDIKDPLWYAAKWGGYPDIGGPSTLSVGADPSNYVQVNNPATLREAFGRQFQAILDRSSSIGAVAANSSQSLDGTTIFQASFNLKKYTGELKATRVAFTPGTGSTADLVTYTPLWTASTLVPSAADRKIYYKDANTNPNPGLLAFIGTPTIGTTTLSSDMVDYLRGSDNKELSNGGTFRNRTTALGGIINSAPFYSDDTKTVYVGGNDGMLHGFNSESGVERFAYIPTAVVPDLSKLSERQFTHRYYVDGNIAVSDKKKTGGTNYLVSFMGRGAKGLFGLQVVGDGNTTYPAGVNTTKVWENFGNLGNGDNEMGYLLGQPLIEQLQDGTNVVIFGNGYNSFNKRATLYVVNLTTGSVIAKYRTQCCLSNFNGLATPGVTRSGGRLQFVYAGDYLGNVWKFDLSGLSASTSNADYYLNGPGANLIRKVFTTQNSATPPLPQPITVPITTSFSYDSTDVEVQNKRFIFFGTGSDLTSADAARSTTQSIYGLIDRATQNTFADTSPPTNYARGATDGLQGRTIETATGTYGQYQGNPSVNVRSFSTRTQSPNDMIGKSGWYMDWTKPAGLPSEKVFSAAVVRSSSPPTLVVSSNVIKINSCGDVGFGFLNAMDAYHGGGLFESYFDINRDRSFADETFVDTGGNVKVISSIDFGHGNIGQGSFSGPNVMAQNSTEPGKPDNTGTKQPSRPSRRISWREIVK